MPLSAVSLVRHAAAAGRHAEIRSRDGAKRARTRNNFVGSSAVEPDMTKGRTCVGLLATTVKSTLSLRIPRASRTSTGTNRVWVCPAMT